MQAAFQKVQICPPPWPIEKSPVGRCLQGIHLFLSLHGLFRKYYVPDVYQPSIYSIDYQKLKDAGVQLISKDIDDTITDLENQNPPKKVRTLFEHLSYSFISTNHLPEAS